MLVDEALAGVWQPDPDSDRQGPRHDGLRSNGRAIPVDVHSQTGKSRSRSS